MIATDCDRTIIHNDVNILIIYLHVKGLVEDGYTDKILTPEPIKDQADYISLDIIAECITNICHTIT